MKMRIFGMLLALILCLSSMALAESAIVSTMDLQARDVVLNEVTNTLAVIPENESDYVIMDAAGNVLSDNKFYQVQERDGLFWFSQGNALNNEGLADGNGRILVPAAYGDVRVVSDKWQIGIKLVESNADNYDYKTYGNTEKYYLVGQNDVYYNGVMVGSLSRLQCVATHVYAHGDYLYVKQREGGPAYYDKNLTPSGYDKTDGVYYEEFEYDRKTKAVWHKGSNQKAFCEGCTLTEDEVEQTIWIEDDAVGYDLQGNQLFDLTKRNYDRIYNFKGDYAQVKIDKLYGLIDRNGNEILPCDYDAILVGNETEYFESGYLLVNKAGKVGIVDPTGKELVEFKYPESNCKTNRGPFFYLNDLEGKIIMVSPVAGELPTRYQDVNMSISGVCPVFVAELEEDNVGLVDLSGNALIPFDGTYDNTYKLEFSHDGTVVVGRGDYHEYKVYTLAHGGAVQPSEPANANPFALFGSVMDGKETEKEKATVDNPFEMFGTVFGEIQTQADVKEVESDQSVCAGCGYVAPAGQTPKFCSECGTPFPQKTVCKGCGFEPPAGTTPKFCSECGTAF